MKGVGIMIRVTLILTSLLFAILSTLMIYSYTVKKTVLQPYGFSEYLIEANFFSTASEVLHEEITNTLQNEIERMPINDTQQKNILKAEVKQILKYEITELWLMEQAVLFEKQLWDKILDEDTIKDMELVINLEEIKNNTIMTLNKRLDRHQEDGKVFQNIRELLNQEINDKFPEEIVYYQKDLPIEDLEVVYEKYKTIKSWILKIPFILLGLLVFGLFLNANLEKNLDWMGRTFIKISLFLGGPAFIYFLTRYTGLLSVLLERWSSNVLNQFEDNIVFLILNVLKDINTQLLIPIIFLFIIGIALKED